MRTPTLVFFSAVVVVAAFVGCSGTDPIAQCDTDPACAGTGTGTGGSTSSVTGSTMTGGTGGVGGVASTTSTSSTSSTSSTASASGSTGTGSGTVCGGKLGKACLPNEYCDYPADTCSFADESGACTLRPTGCPAIDTPACACDGTVYSSPCAAAAAGVDINLKGACTPPAGKFPCGAGFCEVGITYCEQDISDVGGVPSTYGCKPLPPSCGNPATCACLANVMCGSMCAPTGDGTGLLVSCPGG